MKRTVAALASIATIAALAVWAPAAQASDHTTITLKISNCDGCAVQPTLLRTDADGTTVTYTGTKTKVRNGVAVMKVPTANTPGMSFLLNGPSPERINALPVIVTQYQGFKPGSVVTPAQAKAAKKASGCWIGTSASSITLRARAMTVRFPTFPADGTTTAVKTAWLVPTTDAVSGFGPAIKGVLGTQNVGWPCDAG
jgi:hypothetical protein